MHEAFGNRGLMPAQFRLLMAILAHIDVHGLPPSFRDLMRATGVRSPNVTAKSLAALKKKGMIDYEPRKARTIRPLFRFIPAECLAQLST